MTSDSSSLPATLTLTVIPGNSYDDGSIAVFPSDPRLASFKIPFRMGNRPFNITSNVSQASITVEQVTVPLPYNNVAVPGSRINLGAPDQTPSPGTAYRFESWSDGGSRNHRVTMPLEGLTLGVQFGTWYQPTLAANPPGAGTVAFSRRHPTVSTAPARRTSRCRRIRATSSPDSRANIRYIQCRSTWRSVDDYGEFHGSSKDHVRLKSARHRNGLADRGWHKLPVPLHSDARSRHGQHCRPGLDRLGVEPRDTLYLPEMVRRHHDRGAKLHRGGGRDVDRDVRRLRC